MEKNLSKEIAIVDIREVAYAHQRLLIPNMLLKDENLKVKFNFDFSVDYDNNQLSVLLSINFIYSDEANRISDLDLQSLKLDVIFSIPDMPLVLLKASDKPFIKGNEEVLATLLGIALSTFRGYLFLKSNGSSVQNYLLPVINPQQLIENIQE